MELGPRSGKLGRIRLGGGVTVSGGSTNGAAALDEQYRLVLTAHPLQRVGAYALVALATALNDYEDLADAGDTYAVGDARIRPPSFVAAVDRMTEDAVSAALVRDTRSPNGYWLKCSMSFFPNAKMNHNSISKKVDEVIEEEVRAWRRMPPVSAWPGVTCVLCGRTAVGYYGKMDVPLAESYAYRNNTPRGHEGMALCWPCLCSFYALPYGSRLTGGPSNIIHSWDERFLARTVATQVDHIRRVFTVGKADDRNTHAKEVVALRALRHYGERLRSDVELIVFGNNNSG